MKSIKLLVLAIVAAIPVFALNPSKEYSTLPSDYGMDYKEVSIPATDGLKLNAWIFKPMSETKKFIVISDDGNGNMADNIELVAQFLSAGYNVLTYDYRGYGKSDSFNINQKLFIYPQFVKDLQGVLDFMRKTYSPGMCDLYGIGVGAGLSIGVGCNSTQVRRIIADGPYLSFEDTKNKYQEKRQQQIIMPLAYDKNYMEPLYAMQDGKTQDNLSGIMIIVGQNDDLAGPDDIKQLQKVHPKNLVVYIVPGSTNEKNFESNKNEYFDQVKKFLSSH
ncbi:MAG: alpha/beta hydrolase [Chitinophagales bacterium]|jgi:cephalosporin-C deacetylase-like acetyl esterase|nr:alpha/beta hydrolase [Chitinophagales bacterium]